MSVQRTHRGAPVATLLATLLCASMGAAEESGKVLAGAKLYDALYASGGYPMRNTTRAAELLGAIQGLKTGHSISSVLDVGCSWGVAVNYLWGMGFKAAGVDISTIAISRAREVFGQDDVKCNGERSLGMILDYMEGQDLSRWLPPGGFPESN